MEDKNKSLKDKLNSSYDIKDVKKRDRKSQLTIALFIIIILIIVLFVVKNIGKSKNKNIDEQTKTQEMINQSDSSVNKNISNNNSEKQNIVKKDEKIIKRDEEGKNKEYKIQETASVDKDVKNTEIKSNQSKGTKGLVKNKSNTRDESLNENFQNKMNKEVVLRDRFIYKPEELIGVPAEYTVVDKDVAQKRNDYYDNKTSLRENLKLYFPDGDDLNTPITEEEAENFITHEIEKRINPKYIGEQGETYEISTIQIDNYAMDNELGMKSNFYKVHYTAINPKTEEKIEGSFDFTSSIEGGIIWKDNQ